MPANRGLHRALQALELSPRGNRDYAVGTGANDRAYIVAFTRQAEAIIRARAQLIRQLLRGPTQLTFQRQTQTPYRRSVMPDPTHVDEPDLEPVDPPEDGTEDDPPEWVGDK